jgi:pyruvate/2-oxoglutarate dehydrogenase complex dihydrolipoamide acyltransferase (E2) component
MNTNYIIKRVPRSRIATFDIFTVGLSRHHIAAILEFDVTVARNKLREMRRNGINISFNAWIVKSISRVLEKNPEACAYLYGKRKLVVFNDINISLVVEKEIEGNKVPMPMVIDRTGEKSAADISREIEQAKKRELSSNDVVISRKTGLAEKVYYLLPGFARRIVWRVMLRYPTIAFREMGNVIVTSVGMIGRINGWFIHRSVHPLSFGIGSVIKKPVVADNEIKIREILNMTILADHDVIDGAPMVRFLGDLTDQIEKGAVTIE